MRYALAVLLVALASCRSGLRAVGPNGVHIESAHFNVYTDAGLDAASDLARLSEAVFPEYCRLFSVNPAGRTDIYLFDSTDLFAEYADRREIWARGYYRHSRNEIILSRKTVGQRMIEDSLRSRLAGLTPDPIDLDANPESFEVRETLLHEMTHAFMEFARLDLGAWANEGFAEVVGRARIEDGRVVLGSPQRLSLANLREEAQEGVPLRLKHLLELSDEEFYAGASPYPESWAFVDFLHRKAGRPEDLAAFLKGIEKTADRQDLVSLEREWRAWIASTSPAEGMEAELASPDVVAAAWSLQALAQLETQGALPEAERARLAELALSHPREGTKASLRELVQTLDREGERAPAVVAAAERLLGDADGQLRAAAAAYLASPEKTPPALADRFRSLLADPEPRVRQAAIMGLCGAGREEDRAAVQALTKDPSTRTRALAYGALDGWKAPAEAFAAGLADPEWEVQLAAAAALWKRGREEGRQRVFALAEHKETAPRLFAAALLAKAPADGALDLWNKLSHDPHASVRVLAHRRWAERGKGERAQALERALSDPMEEVRVAAIDALLDEQTPETEARVLALLADPSAWVRTRAARLAGQWKLAAAREGLLKQVSDENAPVRHEAAVALAALGDKGGVPVLIEELSSNEWVDQRRAILALHRLTGQSFDFHWAAPKKRREQAIERWKSWWASQR